MNPSSDTAGGAEALSALPSAAQSPRVAPRKLERWGANALRSLKHAVLMRRFTARYFAQLDLEYESLCPQSYKAQVADEVCELQDCNAQRPSWNLNHRFEFIVLAGLPFLVLLQRARIYRERLLTLSGPEGRDLFGAAYSAPATDPSAVDDLRTASFGMLMEIQRLRAVRSEFERLRNRLIFISILPGSVFTTLAIAFAPAFWKMSLAEVAAILGLLGGYLSVLLRLGSLRWTLSYATNYQQVDRLFWNLFLNFCLSMLEGALGAIVLYIALSAGVLAGSVFPRIPFDFHRVLLASDLNHESLTRLMLWCVVAGFSERAVPDLLSGLGNDLSVSRRSNGVPSAEPKPSLVTR